MIRGLPGLKIKLFADGADKQSMLEMLQNPLVQGFTTNPTLMRGSGVSDYVGFCKDVLQAIPDLPISFEVFADEFDDMERQARRIAKWGDNVYVKIPVTNSRGQSSHQLVRKLSGEGIQLNITAILAIEQVDEVTQALRDGAPSVVSVFAGRVADTGRDPVPFMKDCAQICRSVGNQIELLWASPREVLNIYQAEQVGCQIITATPDLIRKTSLFDKDLHEFSLETVAMFKSDAEKAGYQL